MPFTNEEVFDLASNALREMLRKRGPDHKFPADAIWQYVTPGVVVESTARPHQAKRLMKAGLLAQTGAMTQAQSEKRAGSKTPEYRFGPVLVLGTTEVKFPLPTFAISTSQSLTSIQALMDAEGYVIKTVELANFFLAMTVSPLVILSGISGTGKSLLPRKFAQRTNSIFKAIPVQPQWADNSDLFGYVPTLSPTSYIKGALVGSLIEAKKNETKLVIALLDEMNLAPVEHYFSDFLSVAETRVRKGARIATDELPIELPQIVAGQTDIYAELRGMQLPSNLRIVGTANMDETTHSFSPKVLDRAFTIEFDDPDLMSFASGTATGADEVFDALSKIVINESNAISVLEARVKSQDLFDHIAEMLSEVQDILVPAGIKFGYRTRDGILLYLHFWRELGLADIMAGYAAFDFCLLQKVLPKVSGTGEGLAEALKNLAGWLKARSEITDAVAGVEADFAGPLERSHEKVIRMADQLELDGATHYWGT